LPALMRGFQEMSATNFQRQLLLASLNGKPPAEIAAVVAASMGQRTPVTPGQIQQVAPPGAAPNAAPLGTPENPLPADLLDRLITDIYKCFTNNIPGDGCAIHIAVFLPEALQALGPMIGDPAQLNALVQQVPALAQLANGPATQHAWAQFVHDFVSQMNGAEVEEDDGEDDAVDDPPPPPTNGADVATPRPRRSRKKAVAEMPKPVN